MHQSSFCKKPDHCASKWYLISLNYNPVTINAPIAKLSIFIMQESVVDWALNVLLTYSFKRSVIVEQKF